VTAGKTALFTTVDSMSRQWETNYQRKQGCKQMNSETGMALQGEDFEMNTINLRGLFVTGKMGGSATYPSARVARQARQRFPGSGQGRTFRHHSRL
jgi:hypothetical protein